MSGSSSISSISSMSNVGRVSHHAVPGGSSSLSAAPACPPSAPSVASSVTHVPGNSSSSCTSRSSSPSPNMSMMTTTGQGRWYFSAERLHMTPSRRHNITSERELGYRQQAANFIQDMGQRLHVPQLCINTAIVYMQRFYMFHSFTHFHRNTIAVAALFLAAKVEEQPRKLEHVIKVAHICLHRDQPPLDIRSEQYLEQAQELVTNENILLQTLGFDVAIDHPHTHVVKCCQLVKASKDLAQTSYFMATNSLHLTTMCLRHTPTIVACVCIHLACKWTNYKIPLSSRGKEWFLYVDPNTSLELLNKLTDEFLTIFDRCPSRLKKKIMATAQATKEEEERRASNDIPASHYTPDYSRRQEAPSSSHSSKHPSIPMGKSGMQQSSSSSMQAVVSRSSSGHHGSSSSARNDKPHRSSGGVPQGPGDKLHSKPTDPARAAAYDEYKKQKQQQQQSSSLGQSSSSRLGSSSQPQSRHMPSSRPAQPAGGAHHHQPPQPPPSLGRPPSSVTSQGGMTHPQKQHHKHNGPPPPQQQRVSQPPSNHQQAPQSGHWPHKGGSAKPLPPPDPLRHHHKQPLPPQQQQQRSHHGAVPGGYPPPSTQQQQQHHKSERKHHAQQPHHSTGVLPKKSIFDIDESPPQQAPLKPPPPPPPSSGDGLLPNPTSGNGLLNLMMDPTVPLHSIIKPEATPPPPNKKEKSVSPSKKQARLDKTASLFSPPSSTSSALAGVGVNQRNRSLSNCSQSSNEEVSLKLPKVEETPGYEKLRDGITTSIQIPKDSKGTHQRDPSHHQFNNNNNQQQPQQLLDNKTSTVGMFGGDEGSSDSGRMKKHKKEKKSKKEKKEKKDKDRSRDKSHKHKHKDKDKSREDEDALSSKHHHHHTSSSSSFTPGLEPPPSILQKPPGIKLKIKPLPPQGGNSSAESSPLLPKVDPLKISLKASAESSSSSSKKRHRTVDASGRSLSPSLKIARVIGSNQEHQLDDLFSSSPEIKVKKNT